MYTPIYVYYTCITNSYILVDVLLKRLIFFVIFQITMRFRFVLCFLLNTLFVVYSAKIETNETNTAHNAEKSSNGTAVAETKTAASSNTPSYVVAPSFFSSGKLHEENLKRIAHDTARIISLTTVHFRFLAEWIRTSLINRWYNRYDRSHAWWPHLVIRTILWTTYVQHIRQL